MPSQTLFQRMRAIDLRIWAALVATLLLIGGVMWVVPTTPESNSFTFDSARRGIESARPIAMDQPVQGSLVDGSDADFYRVDSVGPAAVQIDMHLTNGSAKLIPGLRVFDSAKNLIVEKSSEYVRSPGTDIDCSFATKPDMPYYVQVFGQRNTTGPYTLIVTARKQ